MVNRHIVRATMQGGASQSHGIGDSDDPSMRNTLDEIHEVYRSAKPKSTQNVYAGKQKDWHKYWLQDALNRGLPEMDTIEEGRRGIEYLKRYAYAYLERALY